MTMNRKLLQLPLVAALAIVSQANDCTIIWEPPEISRCPMSYSTDPAFKRDGEYARFSTDIPAKCPVAVEHPDQQFSYVVNGEFAYSGSIGQVDGSTYYFEAMDAYRGFTSHAAFPQWHYAAGTYTIHAAGTYTAAFAGLNPPGVSNADYLRSYLHRIGDNDNVWAELKAYYGQGEKIIIIGRDEVIGWEGFDLTAEVHDMTLVPPLSYSWTRNGIALSANTESFHYWGSPPDSNDDFEVTVTDINGVTNTQTHHVRTKNCVTEGCNDM